MMRKRTGETEMRVGLDPIRTEPTAAAVAVEAPPAAAPAAGPLPFSLSELRRESTWCDDIVAAGACWGIFLVEAAVSSGVTAEPVVV